MTMAARSDVASPRRDLLEAPGLNLQDPKFVALMFLLGLGDPQEYRRGLEHLVGPCELSRWGDFTAAAEDLQELAPWSVRAFAAHDVLVPDIAYVQVHADAGPGASKIVTLFRPPGSGGRWFIHDFGAVNRSPRASVPAELTRQA